MDFCQQKQVLPSSPCSKLTALPPSSIDEIFSAPNTENDGSLEWLSVLVEDCLSSTAHCLPPASTNSTISTKPSAKTLEKEFQKLPQGNLICYSDVPPCKSRSKRKRAKITKNVLASWSHQLNPDGFFAMSTDPPLLQQEHWLADSELIVPRTEKDQNCSKTKEEMGYREEETEGQEWKKIKEEGGGGEFIVPKTGKDQNTHRIIEDMGYSDSDTEGRDWKKKLVVEGQEEVEGGGGGGGGGKPKLIAARMKKDKKDKRNVEEMGYDGEEREGQAWKRAVGGVHTRRCSHCLAHRTPQWRAGPLGPKTLCNACGVRYKSGRLLPEYRPAKSPTFVSYLHSNSHKKVMEMRTGFLS